jgi:hypothetical protein
MTRVRMLAASARPLSEVLVDAPRASLAMRLQKNARTDPSDAASHNGVPVLTCTGHLVPPLRWWRQLPAPAFTGVHVAVLRRAVAGIFIIGEQSWPAAAPKTPHVPRLPRRGMPSRCSAESPKFDPGLVVEVGS